MAATWPTTWKGFLNLVLADAVKGPLILQKALVVKTATEDLLTTAGLPIPWAGANLPSNIEHHSDTSALEARVIEMYKLGDRTLLAGLKGFLGSPMGQMLLQLLLGLVTKVTTTPAASGFHVDEPTDEVEDVEDELEDEAEDEEDKHRKPRRKAPPTT